MQANVRLSRIRAPHSIGSPGSDGAWGRRALPAFRRRGFRSANRCVSTSPDAPKSPLALAGRAADRRGFFPPPARLPIHDGPALSEASARSRSTEGLYWCCLILPLGARPRRRGGGASAPSGRFEALEPLPRPGAAAAGAGVPARRDCSIHRAAHGQTS